jgi:DNA (cytosine-5)-methyltransferase 1
VAEIEAFPSAVLAHHYPDVPNLGDITKFKEWPDLGAIDLICGGTPCQSFSIAGLRKGLADPRGNLSLTFLAIVDRYRPRYVIWENVPGVLSDDGGRSFASIVGGLGQLGYGWAYRVLDAQYVRVDGLGRAVPQRRRRVIVVGYLGDWRRAAAVLSEPESVLGNSPPRREAREGFAAGALAGTSPGGGWRVGADEAAAGQLVAFGGGNCSGPIEVAARLAAHGVRQDFEVETFVANPLRAQAQHSHRLDSDNDIVAPLVSACEVADTLSVGANQTTGFRGDDIASRISAHDVAETLTSNGDAHSGFREAAGLVAHSLRAEGFDASEDGTGRQTLVPIAIQERAISENPDAGPDGIGVRQDGAAYTLEARTVPQAVSYGLSTQQEPKFGVDVSPTLALPSKTGGGQVTAVAFQPRFARNDRGAPSEIAYPLTAEAGRTGKGDSAQCVQLGWAVRRLMPVECERLMGFPDGYTDIPHRGKRAADGPRYKALGNSWAVNVFRWVGRRIEMVEQIAADLEKEAAA